MSVSRSVLALVLAGSLMLAGCTAGEGATGEGATGDGVDAAGTTPAATPPHASTPSPTPASAAPTPPAPSDAADLVETARVFHDAGSQADVQLARLEEEGRDADAALIRRIAAQPVATWLGEWVADVTGTVQTITANAAAANEVALLVVYAIPGRDCGLHSAGGVESDEYLDFVTSVANGIAPGSQTWVVLEPDALAQLGDCAGQGDRAALLGGAARILDAAGADVFVDVGHSGWLSPEEVVRRLARVGTEHVAGFSTNTSNYQATADEREWAEPIADATGLDFIIDTSRNGNGSNGEWCNPSGRAIGEAPEIRRDGPLRAVAWVKAPGESDGECNGGPAAGQWWMEGALALAGAA